MLQTRLTAREQRVASREQTIHHVDAESASQVAEAQAAAAAAYSHARRDLQHEFTAQKEALLRERQILEADRYLHSTCLCYIGYAYARPAPQAIFPALQRRGPCLGLGTQPITVQDSAPWQAGLMGRVCTVLVSIAHGVTKSV